MTVEILKSKLHCVRVTGADLEYEGSIILDPAWCLAAGILPFEFVDIWNKNSGARLSTYVIPGTEGLRQCVLNGAAARTCQVGDELIIAARQWMDPVEIGTIAIPVLVFDRSNHVTSQLTYRVVREEKGIFAIKKS